MSDLRDTLFEKYQLSAAIMLNNRVLMAPLTRCMADDELVPTATMAAYYARRADAGLIISEATIIRADGQGYPNTPGIFTPAQIDGWKRVTERVHDAGGMMFLQLWHVGRVAHSHFTGEQPLAPSAIAAKGSVPRQRELEYEMPRALTEADIAQLVRDYAQAAENAMAAGFDGVEIHAANGYLIDQFLHHDANRRTDDYGGSPENMSRFALAIVAAVSERIGAARVGLRLSPGAYFNLAGDPRDAAVFDYLLDALNTQDLAYVHLGIFDDNQIFDYLGGRASDYVRARYQGNLVGVGGFDLDSATVAINQGRFNLVAIGRPFIANPDFIARSRVGAALVEYDESMLGELV